MKLRRSAEIVFIVILSAGIAFGQESGNKAKKAKRDLSQEFFSSGTIPHLRIEIAGTNLTALKADHRKYVRCTVREGETVYTDVGIHLKGAAGSFRGLDDKPALTLNFDKFVEDQKFHGLDKLHLNNSVQDPSYMTEIVCGDLFQAAGVPAARGTHARVELNGRNLGLYVLKEGFDKTFLKRHFTNSKGNLYDSGLLKDITEPLEKDSGEGDVADQTDLKALVSAAQERDPAKRFERLEKILDLDRFLSFLALEVMTWHWDGYALNKNNYRVYHEPDVNKIIFLPHGMDQMFWEPNGPIQPNMQGLIAQALVQTAEGRRRYRGRFGELFTNAFKVNLLTNRVNQLQARIRPALAAINSNVARDHDGQAERLRNLIVQRAESIQRQLNTPEPKPLAFNGGIAVVGGWQPQSDSGNATLDKPEDAGKSALHIKARDHTVASWRARVLLEPGEYTLEAVARSKGLVGIKDEKGEGAGLRISGESRANRVVGDSDGKKLSYDFTVPGEQEVVLIAELRASAGEVWFDSLKLVRKGK